jgi:2-C-methyl-D-erythritol 2,4-cyclodiphosphate synthase
MAGSELLNRALNQMPSFTIMNLDMTVYCEQPKLKPFRKDITENIAGLLSIDVSQVNLKGKTMEQTGEVGKGNAVAADAVVLLELKGD